MKNLKQHIFYIYVAFTRYKKGFFYVWMRYVVARRILNFTGILEKESTVDNLSVHMLFGKRDFVMALWSLASFYKHSKVIGNLYVHSDGSLDNRDMKVIKRMFPSAKIVDAKNVVRDHKAFFDAHPVLKKFRIEYTKFQSKKLLDPFLSSDKEYRLILDSDMLWFKNPSEIEEAVKNKQNSALMMSDGDSDFAYVTFKDGSRLSDEIAEFNSGVTLYRKDHFDLVKVEKYIESIAYMQTRFTDQACYATVLQPYLKMLPKDRYIIKGELHEGRVLRHYTSPSRAKFYILGLDRMWKELLCVQ